MFVSTGALTLNGTTIADDTAIGGEGGHGYDANAGNGGGGGSGGPGQGGGVFVGVASR